jgi:broad specificity phosphatase PhoE
VADDTRTAGFLRMLDELHDRFLVGVPGVSEVWLVRHADAYAGLAPLGDGRVDPPLSERGRDQAERLAARLSTVPLQAVWTSDLRRARETAEIVARGRPLTVRVEPRFGEVRTHWDEGGHEPREEPHRYPFPEPETEVVARMTAGIADVVAGLAGSAPSAGPARAVVVTHTAAISIYLSSVLGLSWGQLRVMPQFTSVSVVAVKGDRVAVHSIGDATHLAGAGR